MRQLLSVAGLICAFSIGMAGVAAASPTMESIHTQKDTQPRYCSVLVGKAAPGQDSPILAEACSEESQAAADSALRSQNRAATTAVLATNLMIWYANTNYGGASTVIYGDSGPCDGAGYRVVPNTFWQTNMSSILRNTSCDRATLFNRAQTQQGTFALSTPTIGSFDNNVGRIQVFSSFA